MRYIILLLTTVFLAPVAAQAQDSVFDDYATYAAFVDEKIMQRDFIPLIQRLGGRDEYTTEQLTATQANLKTALPFDFENMTVFKEVDLGGGVRQEARMYWTGTSYAFYYAMLHERAGDLAVITFLLNTSSKAILERF